VDLREIGRLLAAGVLALLVVFGSAFLWIGLPLAGLWIAGQLTTSNTGFLFAVLGGIPLAMVGFGWVLYRLNGVYERVARTDPGDGSQRSAWLVASSDERRKARMARGPRRLIDVAMTASAVTAMVLLLVWFFFFAHMHLAPMQCAGSPSHATGSPRQGTSSASPLASCARC